MEDSLQDKPPNMYEDFPELDTPLHRLHRRLSEIPAGENYIDDNMVLVRVPDKEIDELVIKSDYPGNDKEKRNFKINASDYIGGNKLYYLGQESRKGKNTNSVVLITEDDFESMQEVWDSMKKSAEKDSIPCYFDKHTQSLVIYLGGQPDDKIHHGVRAGSHRDTYLGVVLARALAEKKRSGKKLVTISDPNELEDSNIISVDLNLRRDRLVLGISSDKIDANVAEVVRNSGILLMDDYIHILRNADRQQMYVELIEEITGEPMNPKDLRSSIAKSFESTYMSSYWGEGRTNIVFSDNMFTGSTDHDRYDRPDYLRPAQRDEFFALNADILNRGEPIPVSILVFKSENSGESLMVIGDSHPDAFNYKTTYCRPGLLGFRDSKIIAQLDGEIVIDGNILTDDAKKSREKMPLRLTMRRLNSDDNNVFAEYTANDPITDVKEFQKFWKQFKMKYVSYNGFSRITINQELEN